MNMIESICVSVIAVIIPRLSQLLLVCLCIISSFFLQWKLIHLHLQWWKIICFPEELRSVLSELRDHVDSGISLTSLLAFMIKSCLSRSFLAFSPLFKFYYKKVFLHELVLYIPLNLLVAMFPCFALTMPLSSTYHLWVPAVCITLCWT